MRWDDDCAAVERQKIVTFAVFNGIGPNFLRPKSADEKLVLPETENEWNLVKMYFLLAQTCDKDVTDYFSTAIEHAETNAREKCYLEFFNEKKFIEERLIKKEVKIEQPNTKEILPTIFSSRGNVSIQKVPAKKICCF